jgi:DNA replication and repair protein RecF
LIEANCDETSPFPWAGLALVGEIDALIQEHSALDAEDGYRRILMESRSRDAAAGRTLVGPQASDLAVAHGPKQLEASRCSTGEQKALLVGLVLAHARLVATMSGIVPIVLLDEVSAHFDPRRRSALYQRLAELGSQVWMTGADVAAFAEMPAGTDFLHVTPGRIDRL